MRCKPATFLQTLATKPKIPCPAFIKLAVKLGYLLPDGRNRVHRSLDCSAGPGRDQQFQKMWSVLDVNGMAQSLERRFLQALALSWVGMNRPGNIFQTGTHFDG